MVEFQARKEIRKILYSPVLLIILLIALVFLSRATYSLWQKNSNAKDTVFLLEKEREALGMKQNNLEARVSALKTDKGVEEAIREKFKVAKEGEGVVVVVDQKEEVGDMGAGAGGLSGFLNQFLNLFK
ncbi:MAG: hypothetical protein A2648_01445 [Candidatus Lloydbacteria bacterium RIFCSPHIGHO2_01_FULL_41_20]|uniref:Septum formation initiator n=1 Tax=Candidatus Lloydbacteria bacterium RIFCSPHIGHO2_01_FULL_41_20 TaxID=1798657 RepID=A0A1G2CTC2_9BACT|nr:MAG: hypothetical protein A2648_01445 [Candidatus Lloydbacteria bacterium RIFCSPHIGHO2_01_FULL_41_20]